MQVREKVVFPMIGGSGGSKSRLAKAAAADPAGQMRDEKLQAVVARSTHRSMHKTHQCRTTFGCWDVEKVHAVVVRSRFPSQNVQSTPFSDHFWKLRCRKSARETHFQVKMCKSHHSRTTFGNWHVEKLHDTPPHCTAFDYITTTTSTTTTPHYTSIHSTTLHYTQLHHTTPHHTTLH